ncbi:MAG: Glu-tRNA(Gln) amidotransferase GatDE subunit D, partial [Nanoarchaeota archaeon]|nr:Glu-tRNA(Gln) amidotransferase GatDE subunit D [Nanoarchaeota archaeon]
MKKSNYQPGDSVEISTLSEDYEGIIMPQQDKNTIILKLKTGYNVGIDAKAVKSVKVVKKAKKETGKKKEKLTKKRGLKTVSILHMGGTISSAVDYKTGGVIAKFSP